MDRIKIEIAEQYSSKLLDGVSQLMQVLGASGKPPTTAELQAIIASPATYLFIATDMGRVVGMLTLVIVPIPSGVRAHIEDVAVAVSHQRMGIGRSLTKAAIERAVSSFARTIDLTSRPSREAAIRLYHSLGFQKRDTGLYRLSLDSHRSTL
jgi:ribosomal protein S18 acetylase RimI-like enzyme